MAQLKGGNYFYCLQQSGDICDKDLFGTPACNQCSKKDNCNTCGRKGTSLCEKCENNKTEGEDNGITEDA